MSAKGFRAPRIADCQNLPLVPVGLVPVDVATSKLRIDLHIHGSAYRAAILDSSRLDALENRIEFFVIDTEAEVLNGERPVVIDEVEGQSVVNVYG